MDRGLILLTIAFNSLSIELVFPISDGWRCKAGWSLSSSSWKSLKATEYDWIAKKELEKSISDAITTWGDIGKDLRNHYILLPRKGTQMPSNSVSRLA